MSGDPSVAELSALLAGQAVGDLALAVRHIRPLDTADEHSISFLAHPRYAERLKDTRAGCVIVSPSHVALASHLRSAIIVDDPYRAYASLSRWWAARDRQKPAPGVHATAFVDPDARLAEGVRVEPFAVVGQGVVIGPHSVIGAHAVLENGVRVGAGSRIGSRVHVGAGCHLGARVIVHPGAVIGADGFGFAPHAGQWEKIEQLGAVLIGDDVEIGANTCIDRGALDNTVIGQGVKLDNLIQIGHNVRIGDHSALAGCVGVAGSARIGAHCTFGGGAIVLGHLEVVDHVHVSAATVITRSILQPGSYSGVYPFEENAHWEKNAATLRHLHELRQRLRALERANP